MGSPLLRLTQQGWGDQLHNVYAGLVLAAGPDTEPVTTAEAKNYCRVDTGITEDDTLIGVLVTAARQLVELYTGRSLVTQTWELALDNFPAGSSVELPRGPVQSVTSIKTYDDEDNESTFASGNYLVDTSLGRVSLNHDAVWPTDLRSTASVLITYVAGYGDAASDVPAALRQAILMLVGHWYENREAVVTGTIAAEVPFTVAALLGHYKRVRL